MNNERMLSIYPNTLGFGFVVFNDLGEILDYGMVSIRPINNDKCFGRIQRIISYYQPQLLILEDYLKSNKSTRVQKLIERICEANENSLKIFLYPREQVRDVLAIFGAKNKYEISKKVCEAYPQFNSKLPEKRKVWEPENYYQGIFDAITLVLTHNYLKD